MMKAFVLYTYLEFKRIGRLLPGIVLITVLVLAAGGSLLYSRQTEEQVRTLTVGVVENEDEEPFIGMGLSFIEESEEVRNLLSFVEVTEKEGEELLNKGEIDVLAVFQDNYVMHAYHGTEEPIRIRFGASQSGIGSVLFRQLADVITDYLMTARAGVYAMQDSYSDFGIPYTADSNQLSRNYLLQILTRISMLDVQEVQPSETDTVTYYVCAAAVLLLLFWGMACGSVLGKDDRVRTMLLARWNLSIPAQYLGKLLAVCLLFFCSSLLTAGSALAAGRYLQLSGLPEAGFILRLLPLICLAGALTVLVYDRAGDGTGGMLFFFFASVTGGLLSGYFYPLSFFPEWIRQAAEILPTRVMLVYMIRTWKGETSLWSVLPVLIYILVTAGGTLLFRAWEIYRK